MPRLSNKKTSDKMSDMLKKYSLWAGGVQAVVGTVGSLYLSEIMKLPPCILCWYQRILMYPLAIILPIAIYYKDKYVHRYVLPFSFAGMLISFYHLLLQEGIIPESAVPCALGVSCTTKYVIWLGFITIPLLSFVAFTIITMSMLVCKNSLKKNG